MIDIYWICVIGWVMGFWTNICICGFVAVTRLERLLKLGWGCYVAGLIFVLISLFYVQFSMPSLYEWGIIITTVILFIGSSFGGGMLLGKLYLFLRYREVEKI